MNRAVPSPKSPVPCPGPGTGDRGRGTERGFTLVELLAALTIFLVVMSASYALFEGGRTLAARGELAARRDQSARSALGALEEDLRTVFGRETPFDAGFIGRQAGTPEKPLDTLEFVSFSGRPGLITKTPDPTKPAPEKEIDVSRAAYSIDEDPATEVAGLVRQRTRLLTEVVTVKDPLEGLEEVAADVVGLRFRYYDGSDWQDTWDSTQSGTLPKMVEATIHVRSEYRGQEDLTPYSMKIFLPIAAETPGRTP